MEISYRTSRVIEEEHTFSIEDNKNCFLEGQSKSNNTSQYFGIWQTDGWTKIVTITKHGVNIDKTSFSAGCTDSNIRNFLKSSSKVEPISADKFFKELEKVKRLLS